MWVGITNTQTAPSLKPENLRWKTWYHPEHFNFTMVWTPSEHVSSYPRKYPRLWLFSHFQPTSQHSAGPVSGNSAGCHVDPKPVLSLFQALVIVFLFFPQKRSLISSLLPIQLKVKGQRTPIPSCSLLLKWNIRWLTGLPYCVHRETGQDGYRHMLQFTLSCFSGFGLILFLPLRSSLIS